MMKHKEIGMIISLSLIFLFTKAQEPLLKKESFDILNLNYPGLEKVNKAVLAEKYNEAATTLLEYYRERTSVKHPEFNVADRAAFAGKPIETADQEKADNALLHKFKPHVGYDFFDYGKDINWQYWPVKDDEIRWQLHRVYWWQSLGLAYRSSGDEKFAKEWVYQFRDWVRKNPYGLSEENDRIAWRPLEVSERIYGLPWRV
jgi:heparan-sulfate lyase